MDRQEALDRVLVSLNEAMLDDRHWPVTSALIDDACGMQGNALVVGKGRSQEDGQIFLARFCYRGVRNEEREHWYFDNYYPRDERVPRVAQLPDGELVHMTDLYTAAELKTSAAYNEALPRGGYQNGLNVRLNGPDGTSIVWVLADSIERGGWGSSQIEAVEYLLPHIRHYVRVRHALGDAEALGQSLLQLLASDRVGVVQLDRRGRILETNDHALEVLRRADGLYDRNGTLGAWLPADNTRLQKLLAAALPPLGGQAVAGSMTIRGFGNAHPLMLHVNPVEGPPLDFGARRVAALVLLKEPRGRPRLDAKLVADVLGLTAAESQVAVMLAEGMSAPDIALTTGRRASTVNTLIQRAYRKLGISRQAELMRLVLSLADAATFRP